jgi:hypothetical protein
MKVFLSYSTLDKKLAAQIKEALEDYGLAVFMAHEDIQPSAEWVETIIAELEACDVFIPILTDSFDKSYWTDQETGIAFAREKLIIPLKVTCDPHGFISRFQALKMDSERIANSCNKLVKVIANKPVLGDQFRNALVRKFGDSWSFANASHNADLLLSFEGYTPQDMRNIIRYTIDNEQINQSFKAQTRLSKLIERCKNKINADILKAFYKAIE